MTYVPVDIFVLDRAGAHPPIPNVLVRLLNQQGQLIQAQALTDDTGKASFLLPSDQSPFEARCYRRATGFYSPVQLDVSDDPTVSNQFNVYGDTLQRPLSKDLRICVAFGYFLDGTKSPFAGCSVHFMPMFDPLIIDGDAVLKERVIGRTDQNGYLEIGLIRCAKYEVMIEGLVDITRTIFVPDSVNVNLPDLLFPVVASIVLDPVPTALEVGQQLVVEPVVWASSGLQLYGTACNDIRWSSSDPDVLAVTVTRDNLTLRGMAPGVASLVGVRYDNSIARIPNTPISGQPVPISVTP